MKIETSADRVQTVKKLIAKAERLDDSLRKNVSKVSAGDIVGLMALMEKLTALKDLIRTEIIFESTLKDIFNLKSGDRDEPIEVVRKQMRLFLQKILIPRVEVYVEFCVNDFNNPKLIKFQDEMREFVTGLCELYKESCK